MTCDARYVLFLNPDTAILQGNLSDLIAHMDARPDVGLVAFGKWTVRSPRYDDPSLPQLVSGAGDAFAASACPASARLRQRELDPAAYDREARVRLDTRILHARQT